MKKMLVVILMALCAVFSVNAIGPDFGVKAGISLGNIEWADGVMAEGVDNPLKIGITGGFTMEMPLGPIAFGAEALYTQKGEKLTLGDISQSFNLDYIEIPVMGKFTVAPMVKVYGGLSTGFLVSAKMAIDVDGEEDDVDMKDAFNSVELGAIAGFQVQISKIIIDARYNHGLTNIMKENDGDAIQLRTLYATVGITF